jgi:hypothetical protein
MAMARGSFSRAIKVGSTAIIDQHLEMRVGWLRI